MDLKSPTLSVTVIETDNGSTVNDGDPVTKNITITSTASDTYFSNMTIEVLDSTTGDLKASWFTTDTSWSQIYNTKNIPDGHYMRIIVTVYDKAGNRATYTSTHFVDNAVPQMYNYNVAGGNKLTGLSEIYYGSAYPTIVVSFNIYDDSGNLQEVVLHLNDSTVVTFT